MERERKSKRKWKGERKGESEMGSEDFSFPFPSHSLSLSLSPLRLKSFFAYTSLKSRLLLCTICNDQDLQRARRPIKNCQETHQCRKFWEITRHRSYQPRIRFDVDLHGDGRQSIDPSWSIHGPGKGPWRSPESPCYPTSLVPCSYIPPTYIDLSADSQTSC